MKAIRGAITVAENTEIEIIKQTEKLLREVMARNWLREEKIISIFFSATPDLTKAYPGQAARNIGLGQTAMVCYQEMEVEVGLRKCIRLLMHVDMNHKPFHVYLEGAGILRPDWRKQVMQIAIDGPSGAGKSTIAKELAHKLGIIYVDTGAMYRTIALLSKREAINLTSESDCQVHKDQIIYLAKNAEISWDYQDGQQVLRLGKEVINQQIRNPEIDDRVSKISTIKEVRQIMVDLQREIARNQSVVMDGRDIGTVVLPQADYKIFLTASPEIRGRRRQKELMAKGVEIDLKTIIDEIIKRDQRDQNRAESPLIKDPEAIEVDTSHRNIQQVVEAILQIIQA